MKLAVCVDSVALMLAFLCAYVFLSALFAITGGHFAGFGKVMDERLLGFSLTSFFLLFWFLLRAHYHESRPFTESMEHVVQGCVWALCFEGFVIFSGKADVSRLITFLTWFLAPLTILGCRNLFDLIRQRTGAGGTDVILIGEELPMKNAECLLQSDPHLALNVIERLKPRSVADVEDCTVRHPTVSRFVVALSGYNKLENDVIEFLRARSFHLTIVPVPNGIVAGMKVRYVLGESSILLVDRIEAVPQFGRIAKRVFDIVVSALLLTFLSPVMLVVAKIVRRDGGPVFFSHERIGLAGRPFRCLKFRSMAVNAEQVLHHYLAESDERKLEWLTTRKLKQDPRITVFGRFIRKTTLDELPQLINVLKGDMSLVGPRPITQGEMEYYGSTASFYTSVRPGLTGLWQVSGRNDLSYEQRVRLDTWYVRNWTPWHDIAILLKTVPAVLFRKGAY